MKIRLLLAALVLGAAPLTAASAMPVSTFLAKADALERKGAMAIFSSDLKRLMNQIKADGAALKAANQAAVKAGKPKAYCTPAAGVKLTNRDVLDAMRAVPAPQRAATTTRDAMRAYMIRRFPCPAA